MHTKLTDIFPRAPQGVKVGSCLNIPGVTPVVMVVMLSCTEVDLCLINLSNGHRHGPVVVVDDPRNLTAVDILLLMGYKGTQSDKLADWVLLDRIAGEAC